MTIAEEQQDQLIELTVGMFGGAPGAVYLHDLEGYVEAGGSVANLADMLAGIPLFRSNSFYPPFLTPTEFVWKFLGSPPCLGGGGFVASGLFSGGVIGGPEWNWAVNWIVGKLNAGESIGKVCYDATLALDAVGDPVNGYSNIAFASVAHAFDNRVTVASYYSVTMLGSSTNVPTLQGVIDGVTDDPSTVEMAIGRLQPGIGPVPHQQIHWLTPASDVVAGTAESDLIYGDVNDGDATDPTTLQNVTDVIDGGPGKDTLSIWVLHQDTPHIYPNAKNIEQLTVVGEASSTWNLGLMPQLNAIFFSGSSTGATLINALNLISTIGCSNASSDARAAERLIINAVPSAAPGAVTLNLFDTSKYGSSWYVEESSLYGGLMTSVTVNSAGENATFVLGGSENLVSAKILGGGMLGTQRFELTDYRSFTLLDAWQYPSQLTAVMGGHPNAVTIRLCSGHHNDITLGAGKETVEITGLPGSAGTCDSIAALSTGDTLDLSFFNLGASTFTATRVTLTATADFAQYLDALAEADGSTNSRLGWFQWNGDTYLVEDRSAVATFQNGSDFVIKLVGLVDLSHATGTGVGGAYGGDGILIGG